MEKTRTRIFLSICHYLYYCHNARESLANVQLDAGVSKEYCPLRLAGVGEDNEHIFFRISHCLYVCHNAHVSLVDVDVDAGMFQNITHYILLVYLYFYLYFFCIYQSRYLHVFTVSSFVSCLFVCLFYFLTISFFPSLVSSLPSNKSDSSLDLTYKAVVTNDMTIRLQSFRSSNTWVSPPLCFTYSLPLSFIFLPFSSSFACVSQLDSFFFLSSSPYLLLPCSS